jgi:hypothetical protein
MGRRYPPFRLDRLFESLGLSLHIDDSRILHQLVVSLRTLSFQVAQLGLEKEGVALYSGGRPGRQPLSSKQKLCSSMNWKNIG